jgi:1,4-dihydroxy-2-naphthoate octaprenyltransferase
MPLSVGPARSVLSGTRGRGLVPVLKDTGRLQLGFGLLLAAGLAL